MKDLQEDVLREFVEASGWVRDVEPHFADPDAGGGLSLRQKSRPATARAYQQQYRADLRRAGMPLWDQTERGLEMRREAQRRRRAAKV